MKALLHQYTEMQDLVDQFLRPRPCDLKVDGEVGGDTTTVGRTPHVLPLSPIRFTIYMSAVGNDGNIPHNQSEEQIQRRQKGFKATMGGKESQQ